MEGPAVHGHSDLVLTSIMLAKGRAVVALRKKDRQVAFASRSIIGYAQLCVGPMMEWENSTEKSLNLCAIHL